MGGKYSAEWWEKIAGLNRELPAQDPVDVVDHLIQATAHGARSPAKSAKRSSQGPAGCVQAQLRAPLVPLCAET